MERALFDQEHEVFRQAVRSFIARELTPHREAWDAAGIVPREMFAKAGAAGFLGMAAPTDHGGGGRADFRFNVVIAEEIQRAGMIGAGLGWSLHNDVCLPYFCGLADEDQQSRWLPGICSGELVAAFAMTEPAAGSDIASITTSAVRQGDSYVVNGTKTFVTNGLNADLVITVVKTDPAARHTGVSLLVLEPGMAGVERGRNLDKLGLHAQDTAELFFHHVHVSVANRLGKEGGGFGYLMARLAQERLALAVSAVAGARVALDHALAYVKERKVFGQPVGSFQANRFALAEMATEIELAQTFVDRCVLGLNRGQLTAEEAAMAKWWCTELQNRVVDGCLQLHGGYGYMTECPLARAYADARVTTIFGGTTQVMKDVIGRSLGL